MNEATTQAAVRILASKEGAMFLRYQVGTFIALDGSYVDIGVKGVSDLIGLIPHTVTQEDVGKTIGVFAAWEMKQVKDKTSKKRKEDQGKFLRRVNALGGIAGIVRSEEQAADILTRKWDSEYVKQYTP